ncbi:MAG: hypothetical protein AB1349_05005 [Elusimicrobiota bacterium]
MKKIGLLLFTVYYLLFTTAAYGHIATMFSDIVLEYVEIGESYNLRTLRNCPLIVENRGGTTDITIEVQKPPKLAKGYEEIPDLSWIQVVPSKYRLGAGEKGSSDVIISIPNDPALQGRHFQAELSIIEKSIDIPPGATFIVVGGVKCKIRFSVGSIGPEELLKEKKRKKMMTLNFELDPVNITIKQPVAIGKKINLRKEAGARLTLINRSTEPVPLNMLAITTGKDGDYEPGDPKFLTIKPKKLKLKGESMKKLDLYLNIPEGEQYKNKKFVFLIQAQVPAQVPVEVFSKLFVTTKE